MAEKEIKRSESTPAPGAEKKTELKTPAQWGVAAGLSPAKLAGVCAFAGWDKDADKVSEDEFKKRAGKWLNAAPGSMKKKVR